jgi:hypothetical protein
MKKFEITKEQLKSIIEAAVCNIKDYVTDNDGFINDWMKDEFPDAFKKELEVGKWYKHINNKITLVFKENNKTGYGFYSGLYSNKWAIFDVENWIEATTQEIESALICECEKLGLVDGVHYLYPNKHFERVLKYPLRLFDGCIIDDKKNVIFDNGNWAQIIETITTQEAEKLLNKKIV